MEVLCHKIGVNSAITCVYLTAVLIYLNQSGRLYDIGKENHYIQWILAGAEVLKYSLCHFRQQKGDRRRRSEISNVIKGAFVLACSTSAFYLGAVLFGAPVLAQRYETLYLASTLTILTVLPCCLHLGPDSVTVLFASLTQFDGNDTYRRYLLNVRLTVSGAWLGAVVVPLDWNRPYQRWPIPCVLGAMTGCLLANLLLVLFNDRPLRVKRSSKLYL